MDTKHRPETLEYEPATPADQRRLVDRIRGKPEARVLVRLDDDQDVAGHVDSVDRTIVLIIVEGDEMDTAGHAISIRLPSVAEADAFRRRVLLTGVLVGTVVLGGAGAVLAVSQGADATPGPASTGQVEDVSYEDATPFNGTV